MTTETTTTTTPSETAKKTFEQRQLNDAQIQQIESIKSNASDLYVKISEITTGSTSGESFRLTALAKTNLEQTVLWATKAVSRQ